MQLFIYLFFIYLILKTSHVTNMMHIVVLLPKRQRQILTQVVTHFLSS